MTPAERARVVASMSLLADALERLVALHGLALSPAQQRALLTAQAVRDDPRILDALDLDAARHQVEQVAQECAALESALLA